MTYLSKYGLVIILVSPFGLANTLLDELSMCAKNNNSLQRLACFDKLTEKAKNGPQKQRKVQPQTSLQVVTTERVDNATQSPQQKMPELPLATSPPKKRSLLVQPQQTVDIADKASQQQAKFGHENKQRSEDLIQQIKATIIKVKKAHYGELIITLDNGQVWRQTDSTGIKLRKDQVVIIKRGALGSFFIGKENKNKRMRAKRVK